MQVDYIDAKDAHIWWEPDDGHILVARYGEHTREPGPGFWSDVGASMTNWRELSDAERVLWLRELALDLHMTSGIPMDAIVREFAKIREFYDLGRRSHMMCRVLTKALTGTAYDLSTMDFDELMETYGSAA
jgi:hypothetical protein